MEAYVNLEIKKEVAYVEFFHPKHNAMPSAILKKLADTITDVGLDDAVKVVVLKSGGDRTFCAGASFDELITINDTETGKAFFSGFAHVINAMRKCPKLIIGRVQGKSVGGGLGLAAATDYCLATKHASIKLSELSIGIGPFVIEPAVSKKMGKTVMTQLSINAGQFFSAEFAKEKGLFAEVFETVEDLDQAVFDLTEKLSIYNSEALIEMKTIIWENTSHWDELLIERAEISGKLVLSDFVKETLGRFKNQ